MQDPHHGKKPGMHAICIPSPSFLDFHFVAVFYVLVGAKKSVCELLNVVTVTLFFLAHSSSLLEPLGLQDKHAEKLVNV